MSERRPVGPADAPWHGTQGGYVNHHCGCPRCRAANALAVQEWSKRDKPIPDHINPDSYEAYKYYGSRTPGARAANAARRARQKARQKASTK